MSRSSEVSSRVGSPDRDALVFQSEIRAQQEASSPGHESDRASKVLGCAAVVVDVGQGAEEASEVDGVNRKTRGAPEHLDPVGGGASRLPHGSLSAAVVVLATLVSVIVSAAVATFVATSLSAEEGASNKRAPSMHLDAIDGIFEERRLDSVGAPGIGNGTANISELPSSVAAAELADGGGSGEAEPMCLDAAKGEVCHRLVVWAMEDGLRLHPGSFSGLTRASPFHAFQLAMHRRSPELCPPPCPKDEALSEYPTAIAPLVSASSSSGSCNYGHIDQAPAHAGCFIVHNGRLLTTKLTYDGMRFDIPGGQTDWHEPARCTAHREALEETGYNAAPRELLAVVRNNFHIYRCELLQPQPIRGHDHEISWVGWMSQDEIRAKVQQHKFRFPEAARYADWMR